jgi:hypothetical protein
MITQLAYVVIKQYSLKHGVLEVIQEKTRGNQKITWSVKSNITCAPDLFVSDPIKASDIL